MKNLACVRFCHSELAKNLVSTQYNRFTSKILHFVQDDNRLSVILISPWLRSCVLSTNYPKLNSESNPIAISSPDSQIFSHQLLTMTIFSNLFLPVSIYFDLIPTSSQTISHWEYSSPAQPYIHQTKTPSTHHYPNSSHYPPPSSTTLSPPQPQSNSIPPQCIQYCLC